jgi:hypothetical protein
MAYFVDVALTFGSAGAGTNVVANMPPHQANDILVAYAVMNAGALTTATAGWATVNNNATNAANTSSWTWKRAVGSTDTLTFSTTDDYSLAVFCIRDADTSANVIDASSHLGSTTSTSTPSSVAVTTTATTGNNCFVLYCIGVDGTAVAAHSDPGFHHILSADNGGANAASATTIAACWTIHRTGGTATPAPTWTASAAGTSARLTVAIRNATNGRIPAYVENSPAPADVISPCHHIGTLNNVVFTNTLTSTAAINTKTVSAQAPAAQADLGIVPFSSGISTAAAQAAANTLRGYQLTLTGNRNMSTGVLVGSFIGATPKQGAYGIGSISQGGCVVRIGSSATAWTAYQVAAKDSKPNLVSRAVWAIQPGYTGSSYGTPGTAVTTTAVSHIQFLYNSPDFSSQAILSEVYLAKPHIVCGGTTAAPVDSAGLAEIGESYRLPVIQKIGGSGLLSYVPIQIGGSGDAVVFDIEGGSLQFPRNYSPSLKEISFHSAPNVVGISYDGQTGDIIRHTNSVISSPSEYYWEINASASNTATWDFSGLVVIGANVTLRNVMTFDSMTFNTFSAVNASGCLLTNCTFTEPPSTTNSITVNNSTSFTNCSFNTTTITAGNSLTSTTTPSIFNSCSFVGSASSGHAIRITTPGTYSFSGNTFTGYGGTGGDNLTPNSGSTSAAIFNDSGGLVTLNISANGTVPSVRNGVGATTDISAAANVTLTGLQPGSEVRAYLGINPETSTELAGVETSGTSFTFSQSVGGQSGYITIIIFGYNPIYLPVIYSTQDVDIPIQQTVDRVASNP